MSVNLKNYVNQYDFPFTIPSTGVMVNFKPITTGQMKNLLVYEDENMSTVEKILDDIIIGCVTTEEFDIDEITLQDRFDLLLEIRKKSKGNEYKFQVKCSECNLLAPKIVDLTTMNIVPFKKDAPKTIKLSEQLTIEVDYIRRKSQRLATELVERMGKMNDHQKMAEISQYTYAYSITKFITPDGEFTQEDVNVSDIIDLLNSLDEDSYKKINNWYVDNDYGTEFQAEYECSKCGKKEKIDIPIAYFFS